MEPGRPLPGFNFWLPPNPKLPSTRDFHALDSFHNFFCQRDFTHTAEGFPEHGETAKPTVEIASSQTFADVAKARPYVFRLDRDFAFTHKFAVKEDSSNAISQSDRDPYPFPPWYCP